MNIEEEKLIAKENYDRIVMQFPARLQEIENKFPSKTIKSKTNPRNKLLSLYETMEDVFNFVSNFTPCKKGCSSCCYYPVKISEIEIQHIESNTRFKRKKEFLNKKDFRNTACPFLKNESCSIYKVRPYACRQHVALTRTNDWCKPEYCYDNQFPLISFNGLSTSYQLIREESGSIESYDIRQVFDVNTQQVKVMP